MGRFSALNSFVQSLSGWLALFGAMSVGFSWLASKLTPMQGFGWADFVAVGIACAAGITLVLAAILAAWRKFRPLPTPEGGFSPVVAEALQRLRDDVRALKEGVTEEEDRGNGLDQKVQIVRGDFMGAIDATNLGFTAVTNDLRQHLEKLKSQVSTERAGMATDLRNAEDARLAQISRIREETQRSIEENKGRRDDINLLFRLASTESTIRLCEVILLEWPQFDGKLVDQPPITIANCWQSLKDYIDTVKSKANGTVYDATVTNIIRNLEKAAGEQVDNIPQDKRPTGIDHLLWRKYEITEAQAKHLKKFFESQKWQLIEVSVSIQRDIQKWVENRASG